MEILKIEKRKKLEKTKIVFRNKLNKYAKNLFVTRHSSFGLNFYMPMKGSKLGKKLYTLDDLVYWARVYGYEYIIIKDKEVNN
jgi:hypothetical protein